MISHLPLPQFPSKNLGQWAECPIPVQGRDSFSDIFLRVAGQGYGTTGAALSVPHVVEMVELQQDGETVLSASPHALRLYEALKNSNVDAPDTSVLHIPLSRLGLSTSSDWPTGKMGKLLLRVLLKAALPANSSGNPALTLTELTASARSEQLPEPMARGSVFTFHMASHTPVAGANVIENLSLRNLRALTKLILFCPISGAALNNAAGNAITAVKITAGREVVFDTTKQVALAELKANGLYRGANHDGAVPECLPVVFDVTGRPEDYLRLVDGNVRKTLKVEYTWASGTTPEPVHILAEGLIEDGGTPLVSGI